MARNRNRTAPATAPVAPTAPTAPVVTAPKTAEKDPRYIAIVMTPDLLTAIRTAADGKPLGGFLRNIVCEKLNVTLTATRTRAKYAGMTDAEKKAAKTTARKTAAEETKIAVAFYREKMAAEKKALENASKTA